MCLTSLGIERQWRGVGGCLALGPWSMCDLVNLDIIYMLCERAIYVRDPPGRYGRY